MTTIARPPPGRWPVAIRAHPHLKRVSARCARSFVAYSSILTSHRPKEIIRWPRRRDRETKTITMASAPEEPVPEPVTQRKQADSGRFRLQVDRQTKGSYATYAAAETAGTETKKHYPILQVAVYDGVAMNKVIELP